MKVVASTSLADIAVSNTIEYGNAVVHDRAVPSYRDGMKPGGKHILYAAFMLGLSHKKGPVKTARLIGEVMAKYHPHGDLSIFGSVTTEVTNNMPTIDGHGNWGNKFTEDDPAAQRYSELRLSKYADLYLVASEYMAEGVIPYEENYDGREKQPIYLPALIPNIIINNRYGIAMGIAALIPTFTLTSVNTLLKVTRGKEITPELCLKHLNFKCGDSVMVSSNEVVLALFREGRGSIKFAPLYDYKNGVLKIHGVPDGMTAAKLAKILRNLEYVKSIKDLSSKNDMEIVIELKETDNPTASVNQLVDKISITHNYMINVLDLDVVDGHKQSKILQNVPLPKLIELWWKFRVKLERSYRNHLITINNSKINVLSVKIKAHKNKDALFKLLKLDIDAKTLAERIIALLDISAEDTKIVLAMTVQELSKSNEEQLFEAMVDLWAINHNHAEIKAKPATHILQIADACAALDAS